VPPAPRLPRLCGTSSSDLGGSPAGELDQLQPGQESPEGPLDLHAGELGPEAVVDTRTEGQVPVGVGSVDVEAPGIGELSRVDCPGAVVKG